MNFNYNELAFETFIPTIIGGALILLALFGVKELVQETSAALKKRVKA